MRFTVLGPLEVQGDAGDVTPSAPKVREVLALLLLHHGHIVQSRTLIDELWGEAPPPSALATLQTYIYKLRKVLAAGAPAETLRTKAYGYVLTVSPEDLDYCRFERLLSEGKAAYENQELERAASVLGQALSLWRGTALADVDTGPVLLAEVTRLEECRLRALEMRIDADLKLGRHQELISELRMLTSTHPLHEVFHAKLMLALQGAGRRSEALDVYQRLRSMLVEDLGLEPSASLVRLHQSLLSSDWAHEPLPSNAVVLSEERARRAAVLPLPNGNAKLPAPSAETRPVVALGAGQAPARPAASGDVPPVPAPAPAPERSAPGRLAPAQLPPDIEDFTGREEVIDWLSDYLLSGDERKSVRAAAIVGMAGVGKTALAVHLAHRVRQSFPDGQLFAELGGLSDEPGRSADVLQQFLRAAGFAPDDIADSIDERAKQFRTWAAGRRLLVVLDDAVSSMQVTRLIPGSAEAAVIITSRSHGLPSSATVTLDVLDPEDGTTLLARMVGPWRVEMERSSAERIVEMCGMVPLALRAAGMRLAASPSWPLEKFADELADPGNRLNALRIGDLDLRAVYDASFRRVGEREKSIFQLLALLPAEAFTASRAADLLGCDLASAEAVLGRLVENHLVKVERRDPSGLLHYAFPELGRIYARERLEQLIAGDGAPRPVTQGPHDAPRGIPVARGHVLPVGQAPALTPVTAEGARTAREA
ncbi:BTAD domain-containing putative transcriptional regulator [Spirillospora sp. CA-294931]|uniref:AfsR/SARP family transcriptional regulator n=1 Tax=Spirillospora sp. CA-294931 TaxID=3240042 RepID=UPI003D8BC7BA